MGVMKEYRQVPSAVELVRDRKARVRASLQTEGCEPQRPPVEQPQIRCGRSAAIVKRGSCINITACPCLYPSLTHNRNINPLENKVCETYIFIKKFVSSFIEVRHYLCLYLYLYMYTRSIQHIGVVLPIILWVEQFSFFSLSLFSFLFLFFFLFFFKKIIFTTKNIRRKKKRKRKNSKNERYSKYLQFVNIWTSLFIVTVSITTVIFFSGGQCKDSSHNYRNDIRCYIER